jgi:hypothetical protein
MKWKEPSPPRKNGKDGKMGKLVLILSRLEPLIVSVLSSTPVFSADEKKDLVEDFREMREKWVDGLSRTVTCNRLNEGRRIEFPNKQLFELNDISLLVKLNKTGDDLLYFVSLGMTTLEKLYLTNRMSEVEYRRYQKVLQYLPRCHTELVRKMEISCDVTVDN